jgi:hypothetical protein
MGRPINPREGRERVASSIPLLGHDRLATPPLSCCEVTSAVWPVLVPSSYKRKSCRARSSKTNSRGRLATLSQELRFSQQTHRRHILRQTAEAQAAVDASRPPFVRMILAFLVINNFGKARLLKFYHQTVLLRRRTHKACHAQASRRCCAGAPRAIDPRV